MSSMSKKQVSVEGFEDIAVKTINLTKKFGKLKAIDSINIKLEKGRLTSILGPNGAGKTTLIKMISTIIKPNGGDALIFGHSVLKEPLTVKRMIGVCPQDIVNYDFLTGRENLRIIADMYLVENEEFNEKAEKLLKYFDLLERQNDQVKTYSGGMKRKLNVAMALINNPDLVILDEPSAGIDPQGQEVVWNFIRELRNEGKTILLTTHDLKEAEELSDYIYIMNEARIIAHGTPDELKEIMAAKNTIELTCKNEQDAEKIKTNLSAIETVKNIKILPGNKVTFTGPINFDTLFEIINKIGGKNIVKNFSIKENNINDVFLYLTRKHDHVAEMQQEKKKNEKGGT